MPKQNFSKAEVSTNQKFVESYIGFGSNLNNPIKQILQARLSLAKQQNITEISFSNLYTSPPMGSQNQPDYVNAVMCIKTNLSAQKLLVILQKIENNQGRLRQAERWTSRTLDLDLLLYAEQQLKTPDLVVPHIGLSNRAFVLYPLQEIAPNNLLIPGLGLIKKLLTQCPLNGLQKLK